MLPLLKSIAEKIPQPIGKIAAHIPHSWRLGGEYTETRKRIERFENSDNAYRTTEVARLIKKSVKLHLANFPEYRQHISKPAEILESTEGLDTLAALQTLRPVNKVFLQHLDRQRPTPIRSGAIKLNTGGTSGQPLAFYVDKHAFAREWAHMHHIWRRLGYHPTDLKLTFRGKNLGSAALRYNAVHNEILVNPYVPFDQTATAITEIAKHIRFLHGYPSSIFEFVRRCSEHSSTRHEILYQLRQNLQGILYGSEFPVQTYRKFVEDALETPSISWYGHSEMCILAYEVAPNRYRPMHSYGFAETLPNEHGGESLIGTSYFNTETPFIRYETGDVVSALKSGGFVEEFQITEGRAGDFVTDKHGQRISLTALIFGRHHSFFNAGQFVQVRQKAPGKMTLVIVPLNADEGQDHASQFDLANIAMDCDFEIRSEPVRTKAGKVPLLIRSPSND